MCKTCHPDVWASFYKNPHYKSIASGTAPPEQTGCEGCHGAGKAHVEARGGKATIIAFSQLAPKGILNNCLNCHAKDVNRVEIRRSEHTQNDVVCTSCHSIHRSVSTKALLAKKQADLSSQLPRTRPGAVQYAIEAPGERRRDDLHGLPQSSWRPAPTWRMSARPRMVDQALANEEPCLKCHTDKRGPFLFEHAAVRVDGCESCHFPHGSTNARLLKRPVLFTLCLECHNGAEGSGRTGSSIPTQSSSHNMADPRYRNCTMCRHVRIHGSNADPQFFR